MKNNVNATDLTDDLEDEIEVCHDHGYPADECGCDSAAEAADSARKAF